MPERDSHAFMREIHADAVLLRAAAREAEVEVLEMISRTRRMRERLSREGERSGLGERRGELGEDR